MCLRVGSWHKNERIGLRAVNETERHTGIARMKQRALPFDDIPMIVGRRGRELLDRARPRSPPPRSRAARRCRR